MSTRQGWLSGNDLRTFIDAGHGGSSERSSATVVPLATSTHAAEARHGTVHGHDTPPPFLTRIAVRSLNRLVIVAVPSIIRLEAEDNYVRIWADRPYLHKDTLTALVAKLDPSRFLRVHRSHAVAIDSVRELHPQLHGEYLIVLADGTEITSGRSYKTKLQDAFGLGAAATSASGAAPDTCLRHRLPRSLSDLLSCMRRMRFGRSSRREPADIPSVCQGRATQKCA